MKKLRPVIFPLAAFVVAALLHTSVFAEGPARRERLKWVADADALTQKKDYLAAAQLLEKAVVPGARKSDMLDWDSKLGRNHELARNYQKALAAYQDAFQLKPDGLDQMLDLARIYDLVDLKEKAIDLFQKILKRDKSRKDVVFALANLYMRSNNINQAREYTKQALDSDPQDPSSQRLMAAIEEAEGDLTSAAHRWEGLLATRPSADDFIHLGRLWAAQQEYDLAEISFKKALEQGADAAEINLQRGLLAWDRGDLAGAEKFWKEAERARPKWDAAEFFLALALRQQGDMAQSFSLMKEAKANTESAYIKGLATDFQEVAVSTAASAALPAHRKKRTP